MLKWLTKKRLKEQHKLVFQNGFAAAVLRDYFLENGERKVADELNIIERENRRIASSLTENQQVKDVDLELLLRINKELRKLFNKTATRFIDSFDNRYKPSMGWDDYYNQKNV